MIAKWTSPAHVEIGSTVAVVSPSAPGVALWPHRVDKGIDYLEGLGLRVKLMPNAKLIDRWVAGTPEARAEDINEAFRDPNVSVVLAAIGGNHSAQLLPYLDFDLIRSNPKILQGYSDITVLLWAVAARADLQTLHGPSLIGELGEHPRPHRYTDRWLRAAWFGEHPLTFEPSNTWTDEFLNWDDRADLTRARELRASDGWACIREGAAEGPLLGGCLETIMWHIHGTDLWIEPERAIFFVETSEEAPSPAHVDAYLMTLERIGLFDKIAGLIVGRPYGYDAEQKRLLWDVVKERTAASGIPVIADVDIGHSDPMLTLPLGSSATIDTTQLRFGLV